MKRAIEHGLTMLLVLQALAGGAGCGDDDGVAPSKDAGPQAPDAGHGDAAIDAALAAQDGATKLPSEAPCGTTTCKVEGVLATFAGACCVSAAQEACGILLPAMQGGTGQCNPLTEPDDRCESVTVAGNFIIPSCCTPQGECGLDATMFGMNGCTSLADVASQLDGGMPMPGRPSLPEPRRCDAADGGSEDGGR